MTDQQVDCEGNPTKPVSDNVVLLVAALYAAAFVVVRGTLINPHVLRCALARVQYRTPKS